MLYLFGDRFCRRAGGGLVCGLDGEGLVVERVTKGGVWLEDGVEEVSGLTAAGGAVEEAVATVFEAVDGAADVAADRVRGGVVHGRDDARTSALTLQLSNM